VAVSRINGLVELIEMHSGMTHWTLQAHDGVLAGLHLRADRKLLTCDTKGKILLHRTPAVHGADGSEQGDDDDDDDAAAVAVDEIDTKCANVVRMRAFAPPSATTSTSTETPALVVLGGNETDVQVWDIGTKEAVWKAKNVCARVHSLLR